MVNLLRSDFLHLTDPARTLRFTTTSGSISNPPTNAELDALITTPANLPENMIVLVYVSDTQVMWLIVSDQANDNWWYEQLTVAV